VLLGTLTLCITTASLAMDLDSWELLSNCEEKIQLHNNSGDEEWENLDDDWNNPKKEQPKKKQL